MPRRRNEKPNEKPFLVVLLTIVFVALGVLGILYAMLFLGVELSPEMQLMVLLTAILGVGYLVAGYGLYKGARWGWFLAAAFTILNFVGNFLYGTYLALITDAALLVLLLLTAKHYGIHVLGKPARPSSPVPAPTKPVATAFTIPKKEKRFVRRKHRY